MNDLHARTAFFVNHARLSLGFYLESLGFSLDWSHEENGKPLVLQVSPLGLELILNIWLPEKDPTSLASDHL